MKKKSASQSAFFNLRVLIGLFVVLAGVFLALAGLGTFSAVTANSAQAQQKSHIITNSKDPLVPNGFDCSKIHELGIDKAENFKAGAIMIACGQGQGDSASHGGIVAQVIQKLPLPSAIKKLLTPLAYGAADVDLVTGTETFPNVTQSETYSTANPDNPDQIVVAYNDSRGRNFNPINISGASVSIDGGATFTPLTTVARGTARSSWPAAPHSFATSRSPPTRLRAMFTSPGWTKAAVASPTTTSTTSTGPRTAATLGPTPTLVPAFPVPASPLWATSPACFRMAVATGGTRAGVSLLHSTISFT